MANWNLFQVNLRKEILDNYLSLYSCEICGDSCANHLAFHHRDRETKLFNLAQAVASKKTIKSIYKEIAKCDVLCHNHHRILHYDERGLNRIPRKRKDAEIRYNFGKEYCNNIKFNCGCSVCGITDFRCLDFHHKNPLTKLYVVSNIYNYSRKILDLEISKCEVVCASCHSDITRFGGSHPF